jgi:glycosyltransferase involved in cell wall biosynthesis
VTGSGRKRQIAIVLWSGAVGGAEVHGVALGHQMRQMGVEATLVYIEHPGPFEGTLLEKRLPHVTLGYDRGRDVLLHPRRFAREIARVGPDGALLSACGFMGAALRAGGYRQPIVATEHGEVLRARDYPQPRRALWNLARRAGARSDDVEVAVADHTLATMRQQPHARETRRIYNGIDPAAYGPARTSADSSSAHVRVAFAGRLIRGKGADDLIEAVGNLRQLDRVRLLIAGGGPDRARLETLVASKALGHVVEFRGLVNDMPRFWRSCDVVAVPSSEFVEACPLTVLEAMASGKPVVATLNGGIPELVVSGSTGTLVPPGDPGLLGEALERYVENEELRHRHGSAGRLHVNRNFRIDTCAQEYLAVFEERGRSS